MEKITLTAIERQYKNNGQHAEQVFRFTLSGEIVKADNKPATECGDYLDIQIKSARATVCNTLDFDTFIEMDSANRYAYVINDFSMAYLMTRAEYKEFVKTFAKAQKASASHGGQMKLRLGHEGYEMREWLERATR